MSPTVLSVVAYLTHVLQAQEVTSNGYDLSIAALAIVPSTISAIVGALAWRSATHAKKQVQSPNGLTTGQMVYSVARDVGGLKAEAAQVRVELADEHQRAIHHRGHDDRRFGLIFDHMGIDPALALEGEGTERP